MKLMCPLTNPTHAQRQAPGPERITYNATNTNNIKLTEAYHGYF